jgi:hypothetical protein
MHASSPLSLLVSVFTMLSRRRRRRRRRSKRN